MRRRQFLAQSLAACAPPVLPAIAEVMGGAAWIHRTG